MVLPVLQEARLAATSSQALAVKVARAAALYDILYFGALQQLDTEQLSAVSAGASSQLDSAVPGLGREHERGPAAGVGVVQG